MGGKSLESPSGQHTASAIRREIGLFSLTMIGVSSIIGSGWLFAAYQASKIAGPAAILSWCIGAAAIFVIGLCAAEVGRALPVSGGLTRYLEYTHTPFNGFITSWSNMIGSVPVIAIESLATVQYLSHINGFGGLYDTGAGVLTIPGLMAASVIMLGYAALNWWGLGMMLKSSNAITIFKLIMPLLTAGFLIFCGFHASNFDTPSFVPLSWQAVLTAIPAAGVLMSFFGFQSVVTMAGETKNPARTVPLAMFGAIGLSLLVYLALQVAFIGGLAPALLTKAHNWPALSLSSPFAELAIALGLNWLVLLLYVDSAVSPSGTGLAYIAQSSRLIRGVQQNGYLPKVLGSLHSAHGTPRNALLACLLLSFGFLFIFRGWGNLAEMITVLMVIGMLPAPLALAGLRRHAPQLLPGRNHTWLKWIEILSFIVITLLFYWSKWPQTGKALLIVIAGLPLFFWYERQAGRSALIAIRGGIWLILWLLVMTCISWFSGTMFEDTHAPGWDEIVVIAVAVCFYFWGAAGSTLTPKLKRACRYGVESN
jgi:amino acid transporter